MDRTSVIVCGWLGIGAASAVFFPLKPKRRACIPPLAWWFCLILGVAIFFYGMLHSTAPSFRTPIIAVGKAYDLAKRGLGRDTYYDFRLVPDGGKPVNIETAIILPHWGTPAIFNGRTFRVMYLEESDRALNNEAIDIEILSGIDTGYHDSLDARPIGKWLAVPLGVTSFAFGLFGLKYMKSDEISAAADDDCSP